MTKQLQQRNAQNVDLLRPEFQHRSEPNYAWSRVISMYMALPALRGLWPMSSTLWLAGNQGVDISGCTNYLTNNNTALFGYDSLAPYIEFDGVNQYLSRGDAGAGNWADITGTEAYIVAAQRGLTFGGWFRFDNAASAIEWMITKGTVPPQAAYTLRRNAGGTVRFIMSGNGVATVGVSSTTVLSATTWYFVVCRFIPSTEIAVFVNDELSQNIVGIPASVWDSTLDFHIGASSTPSLYMDGRASMCFLCAAQLSDAIILSLYEQTRAMYGV